LLTFFRDPGYIPLESPENHNKNVLKKFFMTNFKTKKKKNAKGTTDSEIRNATSSRKTLHTFQNLTINSSIKTSTDKDSEKVYLFFNRKKWGIKIKDSATVLRKYEQTFKKEQPQNSSGNKGNLVFQISEEEKAHEEINIVKSNRKIVLEVENKHNTSPIKFFSYDDNPPLKCEESLDNINISVRYEIKDNILDESPKISAKFLQVNDDDSNFFISF